MPREIRRKQWSFLNVPLMRAAYSGDRSCAVLQWFAEPAQNVSITVGGDRVPGRDAVMAGWDAFQSSMWVWFQRVRMGARTRFPSTSVGSHFNWRAQERLLNAAANHGARVTALETAYVQVILQACGVREVDHMLRSHDGRPMFLLSPHRVGRRRIRSIWSKRSRFDSQCWSLALSSSGDVTGTQPEQHFKSDTML